MVPGAAPCSDVLFGLFQARPFSRSRRIAQSQASAAIIFVSIGAQSRICRRHARKNRMRSVRPSCDNGSMFSCIRFLRMRRPAAAEKSLERIARWRDICPDITLRSTFIVGFPGETDEEFATLLDFIREARLDRVGCFKYSPVDGARANALPDHVPEAVKDARWEEFMALQQKISSAKLQEKVGQTLEILIDSVDEQGAIGRSWADAPEIDGKVYLDGATDLVPGDLVEAPVVAADEYDLWAG